MIHSKQEISQAIIEAMDKCVRFIEATDYEQFIAKPIPEKWSIAEEFDHILKSNVSICSALKRNPLALRYKFGKPNRPLRNFDELKNRYYEKLEAFPGAKAPARFLSEDGQEFDKQAMLDFWKATQIKFSDRVEGWREKSLDKTLLPHPLLGKLMVREMLFFTVVHTDHHYLSMKRKAGL